MYLCASQKEPCAARLGGAVSREHRNRRTARGATQFCPRAGRRRVGASRFFRTFVRGGWWVVSVPFTFVRFRFLPLGVVRFSFVVVGCCCVCVVVVVCGGAHGARVCVRVCGGARWWWWCALCCARVCVHHVPRAPCATCTTYHAGALRLACAWWWPACARAPCACVWSRCASLPWPVVVVRAALRVCTLLLCVWWCVCVCVVGCCARGTHTHT